MIPWTPDELAEMATLNVLTPAHTAREIAFIAGGERAYRAELAWQYEALERATGRAGPYDGTTWGAYEAGRRFRVYEEFVDLDGAVHRWGESWRFEGYLFDPPSCELTLRVADGIQLDSGARPLHPIDVGPFRIAWSLGDNRLHPRDPLHFLLTEA